MTVKKKSRSPFTVSSGSVLNSFVTEEPVKEGAGEFLPLTAIALPKKQPRRYFNPQKMEQLKLSIQEHGILEPLLVRPNGNGQYELVAGERRYRAAQELQLETVPVVIRELDDKKAFQLALIENLQREDLNPIEETEGILELLVIELGLPREEVISILNLDANAKKRGQELTENVLRQINQIETIFSLIGRLGPQSFRTARLPLLNLPEDVLEVLRQGNLEYTKAKAIAGIKDQAQRKSLLKKAISQDLSLSQIKEQISKIKFAETKGKGGSDNSTKTYASRMKEIYTKTKKMKSWDDPDKQKQFEALLEQMEKLL
ncbi:MAG: ParB/RepB/Spo0J family partition protein [Scytonema hyalinum WJT4-NPBG1]|jgi:ParB family chromosome partitioning protein|nr:ParB/RepB/Spo0J family partition protein [Scytonema hyalinum WJT4-NPBG1]